MGDRISQVTLPITVELGETDLTVQALLELQAGQVLRLNTNANGPLPIRVDDRVKFVGPGRPRAARTSPCRSCGPSTEEG